MKTLRTLPALLCAGFLGLSAQAAEDSRSGPLAGFGERLQRHGVKTHAQFWSLSLKNLDTGPRQHSFGNSGDLFLGADLDLATLAGLDGASLHIEETLFILDRGTGQPTGPSWQGAVGSYFGGAPLHNDIGANQLSLLTWQQQWLGGRLDSHLGRTNARRYFLIYNCETVVTCNDPIIDASTGILPPPYGAWGGYLKYRATPTLYLHAGAFESNPVDYLKKRHGLDFGTDDASGTSLLLGIGDKREESLDPYRSHYELNAYLNTANQVDPLTGASDHGSAGGFFKFQQLFWRADGGRLDSPRALGLFGSLSVSYRRQAAVPSFRRAGPDLPCALRPHAGQAQPQGQLPAPERSPVGVPAPGADRRWRRCETRPARRVRPGNQCAHRTDPAHRAGAVGAVHLQPGQLLQPRRSRTEWRRFRRRPATDGRHGLAAGALARHLAASVNPAGRLVQAAGRASPSNGVASRP